MGGGRGEVLQPPATPAPSFFRFHRQRTRSPLVTRQSQHCSKSWVLAPHDSTQLPTPLSPPGPGAGRHHGRSHPLTEWLEGCDLDEKELGHLLVSHPDPFPVITTSRLDGLCIRPIGFSQRPVTKRAGPGGPKSLMHMGQLWTHTLRRLGSLSPDSELETCFPAVSWALWDRFCNNEQVQAWAEGKVELRCNWKLLLMTTELGRPFNVVPNCTPGPVTNTGGPHQGVV